MKAEELLGRRSVFFGAVFLIIMIYIFLRISLLRFQGLLEPDGFFYYSVVKETIQNNFIVPHYSNLSGFPNHNPIGEAPGLIYITTIPYFFLRYFGISALDIMRLLPLFFGLFTLFGVYFLAKKLGRSRVVGLLATIFVALSQANTERTTALIYRGDTFVPVFLIFSLLFLIKVFESDGRKRYYYGIISGLILSFGILLWNGSPFMIVIYALSITLLETFGFVAAKEDILRNSLLLALGLFIAFLLERVYIFLNLAKPLLFTGIGFFYLFIPLLIGGFAGLYLLQNRKRFLVEREVIRLFIILIFFAIGILYVYYSGYFSKLPVFGSQQVGLTTQELQVPNLDFVFAAFGFQPFLCITGILIFLFLHLSGNKNATEDKLKVLPVFIIIISYLTITSFLEYFAIRFGSLLSIPLAILSAYAIYGLWKLIEIKVKSRSTILFYFIFTDILLVYLLFLLNPLSFLSSNYAISIFARILAIVLIAMAFAYQAAVLLRTYKDEKLGASVFGIYSLSVLILFLFGFNSLFIRAYTSFQGDNINPAFLTAMNWLNGSTTGNATVLAVWPDGSVVEGWANRQSYIDSVGGENGTRIQRFSQFLFNSTSDYRYLYGIGKPQYIVARGFWVLELSGLLAEGHVQNITGYGYQPLSNLNISRNQTSEEYLFTSSTQPYFKALLLIQNKNISAYIGEASTGNRFAAIKNIILYNSDTLNYTIVKSSVPSSLNYGLLIFGSGSNVTGATIMGPELMQSNFFKLVFLCNSHVCPYNSGNVTMNIVFSNSDTRIIKINYP